MHIYLIGMTGVGKTTVGKVLSNRLNLNFVDLNGKVFDSDELEEGHVNVFTVDGQNTFKNSINDQLISIANDNDKRYIVSTNGNVVDDYKNNDIMVKSGIVIYLEASTEVIYKRCIDDCKPILVGVDYNVSDLEVFDAIHLSDRKVYEDICTFKISAEKNVNDICEEIENLLVNLIENK